MISFLRWYIKSKDGFELSAVSVITVLIFCAILAVTFGAKVGFVAFAISFVTGLVGLVLWLIGSYALDTIRSYREHRDEEAREILRRLKNERRGYYDN